MKTLKRKICIIIMFFYILINLPVSTYARDIMFYNITAKDGLSQNTIKALFQDSNGYMWIGTVDGLNRYNGYEFEIYNKGFKEDRNIVNGYITWINEDYDKNLWVGTLDGLSKINLKTDEITNYTVSNSSMLSNKIKSINIDSEGNVIVASAKGLNIYDKEYDDFQVLKNADICVESIVIYKDEVYGISKQHFFKYDKFKKELFFIEEDTLSEINSSDALTYISILDNKLYLGTKSSGLYVYNIDNKKIEKEYKFYKDEKPNELNAIQYIYNDEKFMWVGTDEGLYVIDDKGTEKRYVNDPFNKYSIAGDNIQCIMKDSSGLLWIGTYLGLSNIEYVEGTKYINNSYTDSKSANSMIIGLYEDIDSKVWVGIYGFGIKMADNLGNNPKFIGIKDGLSSNKIWDIKGNEKYIFAATEKGLNIIDRKTLEIKVMLPEQYCAGLYVDGDNLWVGDSEGFHIINLKDFTIRSMKNLFEENNISFSIGGVIYKDSRDIYWLGSANKDGLVKYDSKNNSMELFQYSLEENSISDNTIKCVYEDEEDNLWIGTASGLNKYNRAENEFKSYSINDGLSNNTVYSIIFYKENELWVTTNWGIDHLKFQEDEIINVKKYMRGVEFNSNSFIEISDGYFLLGGIDGLYLVNPESIEKNAYIPKLQVGSIKVNGAKVKDLNNAIIDYKDNSIEIELFTNIYGNTQNIKYYYSINDGEWILMNDHELIFSNLESGEYKVDFKADNLNGGTSEIESISFTVRPPIWASPIIKLAYVMIITSSIVYIFLKIRFMGAEIDIRDMRLGKEIREKNELLIKNIELEKRKNNYLINMSHELRTPLNVISSVQQLIVDINKRRPLDQKEIAKYMEMSDNNIKRLLKIINDLVDSSKIDEGNYKLFIEENDIIYVVEEAVLSLKTLIEEKGINLIFDTELEECIMKFDDNAISRCIINVVANASKFTESGGEIFVNVTDLKSKIRIDISDTGIGISQEEIGNIFNRFNQVINSKRELSQGNGLGLTITKKLIELHNGEISVESEVGKGTTFTIILPKNN